jgi:hypothetical protein
VGDAPRLALAIVGGGVLGGALGWLYPRIAAVIVDGPGAIVMQFVGTFAMWILAHRLGLSAIVTIICYAVMIARSGTRWCACAPAARSATTHSTRSRRRSTSQRCSCGVASAARDRLPRVKKEDRGCSAARSPPRSLRSLS